MTRRTPGEGSITKRQDGRYQVRIDLGRNELGKRQRRYGYADTPEEARKLLRRFQLEKDRGIRAGRDARPPRTLGLWMTEWLEHVEQAREPGTHERYEVIVRVHLRPAFGHLRPSQFEPVLLERFLDRKLRDGYSVAYVRLMMWTLSGLLRRAEKLFGWRNFVGIDTLDIPSVAPIEEMDLSLEEAKAFLQTIKGDRLYALYLMAMVLGQRQGTMLGLRWADVAEDYSRVRLPMRLIRVKGEWQLRSHRQSRTKKAPRTLPLPAPLADALREHRARQERERDVAGSRWVEMEHEGREVRLVFTSVTGGPLNGTSVTRWFQAHLKQAGLERRRFHDLRSSAATIMSALGIPIEIISQVLAHSGLQMTQSYVHLGDERLRKELAVLDGAWGEEAR